PDGARDREIELAHQDRQAEAERDQAERCEQLHHAEDRADAEEIAGAAIHQRQHQDRAGHDGERPRRRFHQEFRPAHHRRSPMVWSMMTASTIRPVMRYCSCWLKPRSNRTTSMMAMTVTPISVRTTEPEPPWMLVPPTSTAAMAV